MFEEIARVTKPDAASAARYPEPVDTASLAERAALVALLRSRPQGLSWTDLTWRVRQASSAVAVLDELQGGLLFTTDDEELATARTDVESWAADGLDFLTILDPRYPASLRDIHQAPPFLFSRGALLPSDIGVSVVGSRAATPQGLKMASSIAHGLVGLGVSVIAGLAEGIDTAAHRAALDAGGRTVAVIGTGIRRQYPASNRDLHEVIATRGLLLSQFWPDAAPQKHTFLMRNATMSGYGIATVVVEAGEHSGARAQARLAVEHGRPVILSDLVVARTEWAGQLLGRPGVTVASSTQDVLDRVAELTRVDDQVSEALRHLVSAP